MPIQVHSQIALFSEAGPLTSRGSGAPNINTNTNASTNVSATATAASPPLPPPPQMPLMGPALPPHHKSYWQVNLCALDGLPYSAMYCEVLREFRRRRPERRLRVLWVGSPCATPRAAQMAAFLASAGPHGDGDGSAVDMVALNLASTSTSAAPAACAPAKDATPTFSSVFSGNDALTSAAAAAAATGVDRIIEDNAPKRGSALRKQTLDNLWANALNYGGLYVLENVDDPNDTQMLIDVLGWAR